MQISSAVKIPELVWNRGARMLPGLFPRQPLKRASPQWTFRCDVAVFDVCDEGWPQMFSGEAVPEPSQPVTLLQNQSRAVIKDRPPRHIGNNAMQRESR